MSPSTPPDESAPPTTDVLFDVLRDRSRRHVLRHLAAAGGTMSVDELVEALTSTLPDDPDPSSVRLSLQHVHLPKLRDGGLVDRSRVADTVRLRWGRDVNASLLLLDAVDGGVDRPGGTDRGDGRPRDPGRGDGREED